MHLNLAVFLYILTTTMCTYMTKDLVISEKRCRKICMFFSSGFTWQERKWGLYCLQDVPKLSGINTAHTVPFWTCQKSAHYLYHHCHI